MTEAELIHNLKNGDREAFNCLIEQYQNKIINIAFGMLSDTEDAMDASQEVFINVYKSIHTFKENSSFSTWIYRICANVCKDFLRRRMRQAKTVSIYSAGEDEDDIMEIPDSSMSPEQTSEQKELQREIRRAMDSLTAEHKTVLVMCDIEGMSYEQMADVLNLPIGTVRSRINRARQALRKKVLENRELFQ